MRLAKYQEMAFSVEFLVAGLLISCGCVLLALSRLKCARSYIHLLPDLT